MYLADILKSVAGAELHGDGLQEVSYLTCDSRRVQPGSLFFALRGSTADGHAFINKALEAGASAVVLEDQAYAPVQIPWIKVPDARAAMALMAATFQGAPTAHLPLIGITGTNGKTTTTYLIEGILTAANIPAAVLGTISYRFGSRTIDASHTTPESTELQAAFKELAAAGAKAFVMEVSSHALEQKRVDGCHFDVGIFSNLTRDHLDYHGTMENYLESKLRLFSELLRPDTIKPQRRAVVNMDDAYGAIVAEHAACQVITFGISYQGDVRVKDLVSSVTGIRGTLVTPMGEIGFSSHLIGRFNLSNILAAAAAGISLDLPLNAIKAGIEGHSTVPGRVERVENSRGITVLVDYAHTGDALQNVLSTLKELATRRIITVFGCGGDRDNGKRPIMGRIATELSDLAIVTSDNPRTEDPLKILEQIRAGIIEPAPTQPCKLHEYSAEELLNGFTEKGFIVLENRRDAIRLAVRLAAPGDIVLLAGKGHENYQIIGRTKHHFDDREEAAAALAELGP